MRGGQSDLSLFFAPARVMFISATKGEYMLVEFGIVPQGAGTSLGSEVAEILSLVDARGLAHSVVSMGIVVEEGWEKVLRGRKRCYKIALLQEERVLTTVMVDGRKGAKNMVHVMVRSVGKRLGKVLKK